MNNIGLAIIERDGKILLFKRGNYWTLPEYSLNLNYSVDNMLKNELELSGEFYRLATVCDILQNGPESNDAERVFYHYVYDISENWVPNKFDTKKYTECKWFDPQLTFNEPLTYNTRYIQRCYNALRMLKEKK